MHKSLFMRVVIINTSERIGGAAIAARRLMESLKNNGIKVKMLVRDKQTDELNVVKLSPSWKNIWNFFWERCVLWIINRFKKENIFAVDIANTGRDVTNLPEFKQADIIHLHWINQGMLSLKDIKEIIDSGKPIVWTMHDMWPCTGICHYARTCDYYQTHCHNCQYLYKQGGKKDISFRTFAKKEKLYKNADITFVTCSDWLRKEAEKSALLTDKQIVRIPNPINTNLFKPKNKEEIRKKMNLPLDKKLLLFGSLKITDKRKGVDYFIESCHLLVEKYPELKESLGVVVFGNQSDYYQQLIPFQTFSQAYVASEKDIVDIYNAVDIFVVPSLEDNLPNTIMEAMACGIPCVGFDSGGIPEMIDHLHNGYVAEYKSAADFANGIYWTFKESEYKSLSEQAHRKVLSSYTESIIARKYIQVYNKVTGTHE